MTITELLIASGALRFGSFTLKDGTASPFFVNLGTVATGEHLLRLGEHLADAVLTHYPDATSLFGPAYKGFTLATAAAIALAKRGHPVRAFFDRKEAKQHGEGGIFFGATPELAEGSALGSRERIVVLDDVTTSGATKSESFAKIEATFGVRPVGVLVVVDRRAKNADLPFAMHALCTLQSLAQELRAKDPTSADLLEAFLKETR
jgi:orotate phosphoribosyltransferase